MNRDVFDPDEVRAAIDGLAAIEAARSIAQNQHSELLIHGRNGEIRERDSFGGDPFPPRG